MASAALGNTDDHLRNHGFLSARGAWTLSPAFDVNPQPDAFRPRSTSIMGADSPPDEAEALISFAEECDLDPVSARGRMASVMHAVENWRERARTNGIASREIALMGESVDARLRAVARVCAKS